MRQSEPLQMSGDLVGIHKSIFFMICFFWRLRISRFKKLKNSETQMKEDEEDQEIAKYFDDEEEVSLKNQQLYQPPGK